MRIIAVLAVRNELPYLRNNLRNLIANGIEFAIIDNDSSDGTETLARSDPFAKSLVAYRHFPYFGEYNWEGLLRAKEELIAELDADWVIHLDADEIMHSYNAGERLDDAIKRIDADRYDVIDFDEFVFLPIERSYDIDCVGYQQLRHYYFFRPNKLPRLMRARRKHVEINIVDSGGHGFASSDIRLAPEKFALRHYLFINQAHAYAKYTQRPYRAEELKRGWHIKRHAQPMENFRFPSTDVFEYLSDPSDRDLCRDRPYALHYWQWGGSQK